MVSFVKQVKIKKIQVKQLHNSGFYMPLSQIIVEGVAKCKVGKVKPTPMRPAVLSSSLHHLSGGRRGLLLALWLFKLIFRLAAPTETRGQSCGTGGENNGQNRDWLKFFSPYLKL